ncbi:hypothetical protein [Sphingomonas tagetis]|nr:hypothetical protein [Sphingomonas tagetis]
MAIYGKGGRGRHKKTRYPSRMRVDLSGENSPDECYAEPKRRADCPG